MEFRQLLNKKHTGQVVNKKHRGQVVALHVHCVGTACTCQETHPRSPAICLLAQQMVKETMRAPTAGNPAGLCYLTARVWSRGQSALLKIHFLSC
mmetsp:Transcript_8889/g.14674  ORF Transcript_8889/g.14674 Transcript_8889/m.14674 type:complete len:95 (+) Transcript_8889:304-588(+)